MSGLWLLDVNVLVALFNPDHIHHDTAHDWFAENHTSGWATCPLTEQGVVRILANPKYWSEFERTSALVERLAKFCSSRHHHFWSDTVSLRDRALFDLLVHRGTSSADGCLPARAGEEDEGTAGNVRPDDSDRGGHRGEQEHDGRHLTS